MNVTSDIRLINLNSSYAILNNSTYLSDVLFPFKGLLKKETDIIEKRIIILNAQIPVSFYNINYSNNVLNYSVSSISYSITIPVGNYNATSLNSTMTSLFLINGHTITISINKYTGVLTFTTSFSFSFVYLNSTIFKILGLSFSNHSSASNSIICDYPLNLLGIKKVKVKSTNLSIFSYDSLSKGLSNTLASIPVEASSFGLILYENKINNKFLLNADSINEIDIQLCDENDTLINFNNCEWSMTLLIELVRQQSDIVQETILEALNKIDETLGETNVSSPAAFGDTNEETTDQPDETTDDQVVDDETNDLDLFLYTNKISTTQSGL